MPARTSRELSSQVMRRLRHLRKVRGWSAETFAAAVTGAGYPTAAHNVRTWETRPNVALTIDFLAAAATALGVTLDELAAGKCENCHNDPPKGFSCTVCGVGQ